MKLGALVTISKGITTTKAEFREGRYFHQARLIVLRDLWQEKDFLRKGLVVDS
jgi:hypothetical protein